MEMGFPLTSPCVGVCQINAKTKFCLGCWRSLREVAHWSRYSDDEKRAVLVSLRERQAEAGADKKRMTRRKRRRLDAGSQS
jgi:predicted Fe-S protein YdhL (DUF1289 family)